MRSFKEYLQTKGMRAYTIKRYEQKAAYYKAWCEQKQIKEIAINYADLMDYLEHIREQGLSSRSCAAMIAVIRHYYHYLIAINATEVNPAMHVKIRTNNWRRPYETLKEEQLKALHEGYDTNPKKQHNKLSGLLIKRRKVIIGLMVHQGLESQALSKLKTQDINLKKGEVYVSGGKEYNERILDLAPVQVMELYDYLKEVRPALAKQYENSPIMEKEPDILLPYGGNDYHDGHRTIIGHLKEQEPALSSLPGAVNRQIRASVITHWLKQYNLREVQYRSGYKNVCSVEQYQKNDIESLQEAITKHYPL